MDKAGAAAPNLFRVLSVFVSTQSSYRSHLTAASVGPGPAALAGVRWCLSEHW